MEYRIAKTWHANNREDNCCVNLPKKFVMHHKILESKYVIIRNMPDGILIQPLTDVEVKKE